jgi:hypothetical protein
VIGFERFLALKKTSTFQCRVQRRVWIRILGRARREITRDHQRSPKITKDHRFRGKSARAWEPLVVSNVTKCPINKKDAEVTFDEDSARKSLMGAWLLRSSRSNSGRITENDRTFETPQGAGVDSLWLSPRLRVVFGAIASQANVYGLF